MNPASNEGSQQPKPAEKRLEASQSESQEVTGSKSRLGGSKAMKEKPDLSDRPARFLKRSKQNEEEWAEDGENAASRAGLETLNKEKSDFPAENVTTLVPKTTRNEESKAVSAEDEAIKTKMGSFIHKTDDFICPICLKFIVSAVNFCCGHTFCEVCITDYLLIFKKCPRCTKNLRKSHFNYSIVLDSLIDRYLNTTHAADYEDYKRRYQLQKDWSSNRKKTTFEVGEKLDVRTKEYIWCVGTIKRIARKHESQSKILWIHYDGLPSRADEEIKDTSPRLSTLGFYSNRTDVPKFDLSSAINPMEKLKIKYKGQCISEYYYGEMEGRVGEPKNYDDFDSSSCSEDEEDPFAADT